MSATVQTTVVVKVTISRAANFGYSAGVRFKWHALPHFGAPF